MNKNTWVNRLKMTMAASLALPIMTFSTTAFAEEQEENSEQEGSIEAESALLVDFETGQVLYNQNAEEQRGIASMTKMLVEYILFEELEAGNLSWDSEVTISEYAHNVSQNYTLSNVPLHLGGTYTVEELYEAIAIYSANGATIALAEEIEGSETAFVDRMRELVESWGIEDYELYNTTGLNNAYLLGNHYPGSNEDDENTMSAKNIAIVATNLLEDYPEVLDVSSIPSKVFREGTGDAIEMMNWNWMLEGLSNERADVDGLKTGTTEFAGATFTGTAVSDDTRLVSVVMGAGDGFTNKSQRFVETSKLLDHGFEEWEYQTIVETDTDLEEVESLSVRNGVEEDVSLKTVDALAYYLPKDVEIESIDFVFEPNEELLNQNGELEAPINEDDVLGELIMNSDEEIEFLEGEEQGSISVAAADSVERAGYFTVFTTWLKDFFNGLRDRF